MTFLKPLGELKEEKRKLGKVFQGRTRKLAQGINFPEGDERSVIRSLVNLRENVGTFSSRDIQNDCGLQHKVSNETIRRCLKKHPSMGISSAVKKGC